MRQIQVLVWCDACNRADRIPTPAVVTITLAIDGDPKTLDLCEDDFKPLAELYSSHGLKPDKKTKKSAAEPPRAAPKAATAAGVQEWRCPKCPPDRAPFGSRSIAMSHLMSQMHGMTNLEASHAIPPPGPTHECPTCGVLLPAHAATVAKHYIQVHDGVRPAA